MLEAGCIVLFIILSDKFNIIFYYTKLKKGGEKKKKTLENRKAL